MFGLTFFETNTNIQYNCNFMVLGHFGCFLVNTGSRPKMSFHAQNYCFTFHTLFHVFFTLPLVLIKVLVSSQIRASIEFLQSHFEGSFQTKLHSNPSLKRGRYPPHTISCGKQTFSGAKPARLQRKGASNRFQKSQLPNRIFSV